MKATNTEIELLKCSAHALREMTDWMLAHLGKHEHLSIGHWTNSLFYIEVIDERKNLFNSNM
jgi:hypothetical protein